MHMRIGATLVASLWRFKQTARLGVGHMRIDEGQRFATEPQRVGMAARMSMGERQQHAGVIIGVFRSIGDRSVGVQRAHPAAGIRSAFPGHEGQAMCDQFIGRAIPAALPGCCKGIDLPRHGPHALRRR